MPYSNLALDADRENGPAARSFAADAHDCIMVRIKRSYRIQVCGTKMRPNGELPSDPQETDRHRPDAEAMQKAPVAGHHRSACSGVKALRNTSDASRQAAKLCYRFGPLTPSARSANMIPGDGTKNGLSRSEQKTVSTTQNNRLTGKAPYRFESVSLHQTVRLSPASAYRASRTPAFRAGVRGWLGDRVGQRRAGFSISRRPAAISLSGHIPVPQCR
jgi:hypothetical protein